ncbi:serine/threonine protein kinase [Streptomyces kaniharaensis]|uniref:non-specific serine/threonine protein kinase n=1 Tax=Streptomyces kaniharaensis TaxID=212423 RepID=A0A6N7L521_9ACTN|nr:serine/threonine-protein kinase [Streptomyces kaniharaensis]MQS17424.1 serine/threonine protein kinase [Streptomyces kaniharaensis]
MRGTTVAGRYRVVDLLGAGGMGEVWRAVDERLGRPVALKVLLHPEDEELLRRLEGEARAAAALCDPHVVAVHDVGEAPVAGRRVVYLVMELVDGQPLSRLLADRVPAVGDVVAWGEQICRGLQAAHAAGLVHRDIKPANILVTADGRVKVCDFGIARRSDAVGHPLTGTGAVIGTPSYMSPEQARADAVIDARSDLYSLGCLLYELLTGAPPFPGGGWQVLAQHLHQAPAPVRSHRPEVPAELEHLVAELLHKDPQQRPADAAEVARRLRATVVRAATAPAAVPVKTVVVPVDRLPTVRAAQARPPVVKAASTDSGRAAAAPRRSAPWRAGALTGVLVGGQLAMFTALPGPVSTVLGLVAGGCVAAGSHLEERHDAVHGQQGEQGSVVGVFAAMLIATVTMVVLLGWSTLTWWVAVLVATVTGPVLVAGAAGVRALVEQLLRRGGPEAELASTAGLLSGAVGCALTASAIHGPVAGAVAAGAGAWVVSSLAVGALLPSPRPRPRHL